MEAAARSCVGSRVFCPFFVLVYLGTDFLACSADAGDTTTLRLSDLRILSGLGGRGRVITRLHTGLLQTLRPVVGCDLRIV